MSDIEIKIRTDSPTIIEELFGTTNPSPSNEIAIGDGASVLHKHHAIRRGLVESAIIVDVVIKVASGVAVKIISDWLSEKLKSKKAQVEIGGKVVSSNTSETISEAVERVRKNDSPTQPSSP
jgi:hypothetical protein